MDNPPRKRHRSNTPAPNSGAAGASGHQGASCSYQRGSDLICATQPDVGKELLSDLDDFQIPPDTEEADTADPLHHGATKSLSHAG